jgi:hypothetical protein
MNSNIQSMNILQRFAIIHISVATYILISLYSLLSVFYGDYILTKIGIKYNIETRFPKLSKFINLRRKFKHFYLLTDVLISIIMLLIIIAMNIIYFL